MAALPQGAHLSFRRRWKSWSDCLKALSWAPTPRRCRQWSVSLVRSGCTFLTNSTTGDIEITYRYSAEYFKLGWWIWKDWKPTASWPTLLTSWWMGGFAALSQAVWGGALCKWNLWWHFNRCQLLNLVSNTREGIFQRCKNCGMQTNHSWIGKGSQADPVLPRGSQAAAPKVAKGAVGPCIEKIVWHEWGRVGVDRSVQIPWAYGVNGQQQLPGSACTDGEGAKVLRPGCVYPA